MQSVSAAFALALTCLNIQINPARAEGVDTCITTILAVQEKGGGHPDAVIAVAQLQKQPATALIPVLQAMDGANPLAENWLRGAFESIAHRSLKNGDPLPRQELEAFTLDRSHAASPRGLALEWLKRLDPSAEDRLIPGMLDDPNSEFRRESVGRLMEAATKASAENDTEAARRLYAQVFSSALDPDQLEQANKALRKLGDKPDLKKQLGMLDRWWLIGPFDNHDRVGFAATYPPESAIDLARKYPGKDQETGWIEKESGEGHGVLDLNKLVAPHKGAIMYAYHEFVSSEPQAVEIRLGTPNAWKLWVNGKLAFAHEEYHLTMRMDQYRVQTNLNAGVNTLLLKICQDEQSVEWAQRWQFQLRVCNPSGKAVLPAVAKEPSEAPSP